MTVADGFLFTMGALGALAFAAMCIVVGIGIIAALLSTVGGK